MNAAEDNRKEIQDIAPNLSKRPRTRAFDVPDGYFDQLEEAILARTVAAPRIRRLPLRRVLAWAASLLLLVSAVWAAYRFVVIPVMEQRQTPDQEQVEKLPGDPKTVHPDEDGIAPVTGNPSGNVATIDGQEEGPGSMSARTGNVMEPGAEVPAANTDGQNGNLSSTPANPNDASGTQRTGSTLVNHVLLQWKDTALCYGAQVRFTCGLAGQDIDWKVDDGKKSVIESKGTRSFVLDTRKTGSGTFTLTAEALDARGQVTGKQSALINVMRPPQAQLGSDRCFDASELLTGSPQRAYTNTWSDGSHGTQLRVSKSGTYWLRVSPEGMPGCYTTDTVKLTLREAPADQFPASLSFCNDDVLRLSVQSPKAGHTYSWEPGAREGSTLYLNKPEPGTYTFTLLTTVCDRTYSEDVVVNVNDCGLVIPNVITPNGDGANDRFVIENLDMYPGTRLVIFDRSGRKVFEDNDYHNTWDGRDCDAGTYYYIIRLNGKVNQGMASERTGTLTIVR